MTEAMPGATDAAGPPQRRRGRAARAWIIVLVVLGVLAALVVIADFVVRNIAEQRVAEQLEQNLPDGVEVQQITVEPGTASVALEASGLSLDERSLSTRGSCD